MIKLKIRLLLSAAIVVFGLSAGGDVSARQIPPSAGRIGNTTTNCFWESYGSIENGYCAYADYWLIPLVTDFTGYAGIGPQISVYAPSSTDTVGCYVYSNVDGGVYSQSTTEYAYNYGSESLLTPEGGFVAGPTSVEQVVCIVSPTAWIDGVSYNYN